MNILYKKICVIFLDNADFMMKNNIFRTRW